MYFMHKPTYHFGFLLTLNVFFLYYIALFPFQGWRVPRHAILSIVLFDWFDHIFLFDIVQNLILFLPFGIFAGGYITMQKRNPLIMICLTTIASFCMSLSIEVFQTFNPARIPSLLDIALNTLSGLIGAALSLILTRYYQYILQEIEKSLQYDNKHPFWAIIGSGAWLVWGAYQIYPFIPTLHPKQLFEGIMPIYLFLKGEISFNSESFLLYTLQGSMLYFSGKLFLKPQRLTSILLGFVAIIFLGITIVIGQLLTIEIILGCITPIIILSQGQNLFETLPLADPKIEIEVEVADQR